MSAEQELAAARRIEAFLKDEAIVAAFARMERRYYEEFIQSESSEQRIRAWAKATALRDFEAQLHSLLDAGEVQMLAAAKAAAKDKAERIMRSSVAFPQDARRDGVRE